MKRVLLIVVAVLGVGEARAERWIIFNGGNADTAATYHFGTAPIGSANVTPVLLGSLAANESITLLRDRVMPAAGIPGFGKRGSNGGAVGIRVFHGDDVQFWVSLDGSGWTVLPQREVVFLNGTQLLDQGSNSEPQAVGTVPAVSTWGVVVLGLAVVVAGSLLARNWRAGGARVLQS